MLGLSTLWISERFSEGEKILDVLSPLGIEFWELEYRFPEALFLAIQKKIKNKVASIHNYFPFPLEYSHLKPSGDLFLLSSLDPEERQKAIKLSLKTIQIAHELECSAVVLHLGKIEIPSFYQEFCEFLDNQQINSPKFEQFLLNLRKERASKRQKFLDAVLFSLEKLNQEAEKKSVALGIENRYYFNEIPDFEEIGIILKEFSGGKIFYWHDVGHAQVQEKFRIQNHQELLKAYCPSLLGVHLHDSQGYRDHQSPGKGEVDFNQIKNYLSEKTIKILEIHPRESLSDIQAGIHQLRDLGY